MLPSPYSPGAVPAYLAGRSAELQLIRDRLARIRVLGRAGGPLIAFYGSRGLGKTSLLRAAQHEAEKDGFMTVWATGRSDVALAPELARWLADEVRRGSFGDRSRVLVEGLDRIQVELGVPGAKVGVAASGRSESAAIERSLEDAGQFARRHDRHGLAVFVDEFQEARLEDRRSLLIALQQFNGAPSGTPVAIISAGLPSMLGAVPEAATFGERSEFVDVGLLGDVAVAEALRLPAEELGVAWTEEAVLAAIDAAAGYPQQVQLLGDAAWEQARPDNGGQILAEHVRRGLERVEQRMESLFRSRLAKLNADHRRFIVAMANEAEGSASGPEPSVPRWAIAIRLGISTEALSRPRQELIDRGLIETGGRGQLRFTIPGFGAYIRANLDGAELPAVDES